MKRMPPNLPPSPSPSPSLSFSPDTSDGFLLGISTPGDRDIPRWGERVMEPVEPWRESWPENFPDTPTRRRYYSRLKK